MQRYEVKPLAELDGPGSGFGEVSDAMATRFAVFKTNKTGVLIAVFNDRAAADAHRAKQEANSNVCNAPI